MRLADTGGSQGFIGLFWERDVYLNNLRADRKTVPSIFLITG